MNQFRTESVAKIDIKMRIVAFVKKYPTFRLNVWPECKLLWKQQKKNYDLKVLTINVNSLPAFVFSCSAVINHYILNFRLLYTYSHLYFNSPETNHYLLRRLLITISMSITTFQLVVFVAFNN